MLRSLTNFTWKACLKALQKLDSLSLKETITQKLDFVISKILVGSRTIQKFLSQDSQNTLATFWERWSRQPHMAKTDTKLSIVTVSNVHKCLLLMNTTKGEDQLHNGM